MMSVGLRPVSQAARGGCTRGEGRDAQAARPSAPPNLTLSANLPADYVPDPGQPRLDLYRRIALIRSEEGRSDLLDELIDRYGEPPAEAVALLDIALLRAEAGDQGVTEIKQDAGRLYLTFAQADFRRLSVLCGGQGVLRPPAAQCGQPSPICLSGSNRARRRLRWHRRSCACDGTDARAQVRRDRAGGIVRRLLWIRRLAFVTRA